MLLNDARFRARKPGDRDDQYIRFGSHMLIIGT